MKCYSLPFTQLDQEDAFKQLAINAGGQTEEDNSVIRFVGEIAQGQVRKWHLDAGLYMRVWDVVFSRPVELFKEATPVYVTNNGFSLICILTPESVALKTVDQHHQFSKLRERNMVMLPDTVNAELQIMPHVPVQLIDFQIASYWLRNQPGYINISGYFGESIHESSCLPVLIEPCFRKNNMAVGKLFGCSVAERPDMAEMLSLSTFLITGFLEKVSGTETDKTSGNIEVYYEKVMEAETILIAHLQKNLPRLGYVAQRVALSESTLKRYFKLIYGKSIYEYYLNKKMELARNLLLQRPLSVNEAAEIMGYEKVSNFIEIFKKYHGYSPGTIKKKNPAVPICCMN